MIRPNANALPPLTLANRKRIVLAQVGLGDSEMIRAGDGRTASLRSRSRAMARPFGRADVERLVDSAIHDLGVLKKDVTPEAIRDYVVTNIHIETSTGTHLRPSDEDLSAALDWFRLEKLCVPRSNPEAEEPDEEVTSVIRP